MDSYKGVAIGVVIECEGGYVSVPNYSLAQVFDNDGKKITEFKGAESHFANFLKGIQSRKIEDLHADIETGHISTCLCHLGNISYRVGQQTDPQSITEQIKSDSVLAESYRRMSEHLQANGLDMTQEKLTLGQPLKFDAKTETFVCAGSEAANKYLTRTYREPFVVPVLVPENWIIHGLEQFESTNLLCSSLPAFGTRRLRSNACNAIPLWSRLRAASRRSARHGAKVPFTPALTFLKEPSATQRSTFPPNMTASSRRAWYGVSGWHGIPRRQRGVGRPGRFRQSDQSKIDADHDLAFLGILESFPARLLIIQTPSVSIAVLNTTRRATSMCGFCWKKRCHSWSSITSRAAGWPWWPPAW